MRWVLALALVALASGCSALLDFDESQLIDAGPAVSDGGDGGFDGGGRDGGADGGRDAGVIDAARSNDGGSGAIACGAVTCSAATQDCCRIGAGGSCVPHGQACTGGISMSCDGREDCPTAGDVCCGILPDGPALCLPAGVGVAACSGRAEDFRIILCNDPTDCPAERPICQICGSGALSRYCTDVVGAGCH